MEPRKRIPRLDRVYLDVPNGVKDQLLPWERHMQEAHYGINNSGLGTPEERTLKSAFESPTVYFDAGVLPEIVVTPPKDDAVYKAKYMIRDKDLRQAFYKKLQEEVDDSGFPKSIDHRLYINRLWELYNKSQKPTIRPVTSKYNIFIPVLEKLAGRSGNRANYNYMSNSMFVDPELVDSDIEAELAHAYQFNGTDTPRSWNWVKQAFTLPGDIKINGIRGYDRIGNKEFVAHSIIEPIFHDYLTNPRTSYQDVYDSIQDIYNNQDQFFESINRGPFSGKLVPRKKK